MWSVCCFKCPPPSFLPRRTTWDFCRSVWYLNAFGMRDEQHRTRVKLGALLSTETEIVEHRTAAWPVDKVFFSFFTVWWKVHYGAWTESRVAYSFYYITLGLHSSLVANDCRIVPFFLFIFVLCCVEIPSPVYRYHISLWAPNKLAVRKSLDVWPLLSFWQFNK